MSTEEEEVERYLQLSQKESEDLRRELSSYVDYLQNKKGSDGKNLLKIPDNFDVIAGSLDRNDLLSTEEKPWSKYLLTEKFDTDIKEEFDNRYNIETNESDMKIKRGLAEIELLDRQLYEIGRRSAATPREVETPLENDQTFLTKHGKQEAEKGIKVDSPRTADKRKIKKKVDAAVEEQKLSSADQQRIRELLEMDEDNDEYILFTRECDAKQKQLDNELLSFGRLERLDKPCDEFKCSDPDDYLTQQRLLKMESDYLREIDKKLAVCTGEQNYVGLLIDSQEGKAKQESSVRNAVPEEAKAVKPPRLILQSDIQSLLASIVNGAQQERNCDVRVRQNNAADQSNDSCLVSSRDEIERLVAKYQQEVEKLAKLRNQPVVDRFALSSRAGSRHSDRGAEVDHVASLETEQLRKEMASLAHDLFKMEMHNQSMQQKALQKAAAADAPVYSNLEEHPFDDYLSSSSSVKLPPIESERSSKPLILPNAPPAEHHTPSSRRRGGKKSPNKESTGSLARRPSPRKKVVIPSTVFQKLHELAGGDPMEGSAAPPATRGGFEAVRSVRQSNASKKSALREARARNVLGGGGMVTTKPSSSGVGDKLCI